MRLSVPGSIEVQTLLHLHVHFKLRKSGLKKGGKKKKKKRPSSYLCLYTEYTAERRVRRKVERRLIQIHVAVSAPR